MGGARPLLGQPPARRLLRQGQIASIAVLALCLVVGFSGYRHQVALEQAGNPGLSDDAARERLDRYFSLAGKNPRAAVRKTGKETRHSLNSYLTSLSTQKNSNAQEHGNVALTDEEAGNDLNAYFSRAGKDAHASVRKSDTEARQSLNAYISTLDSDAALGKRFCTRHPERCGKAARAEKAAAQAKAARAAAQAEAVAIAKKEQAKQEKGETEAQKLLSRDQAPATVAAPTAAASSHGKAARLGDDVMDLGATKAADDGDLHVKGADVNKYMFTKDGDRGDAWLKTDAKVGLPQLKVKSPLSKLSVADEAELAKCNVPEPRPAYCRLLMDVGMDPASVKTSMPDRGETEYRYSEHNMGVTQPLHAVVPIDMAHKDGATLGDNWVQFGLPDNLVPVEEQHEEGNLAASEYGKEKGGPLNPVLREGATRTQNPHWASEGFHDLFRAKIKALDQKSSDAVLYGALDDYKKLGLVLSDEFVSPTHDAEEREKELGSHPKFYEERFKPLSKYASTKQWREEVKPNGGWAVDDADAFEKAEGPVTDYYAGRSAVEQHLLYGSEDPFNLGHPVDSEKDNGDMPFADGRMKGPGDGAPMPAFPRDTNAMERHPWTDQGHVFYDDYGAQQGGIADTGRSKTTV